MMQITRPWMFTISAVLLSAFVATAESGVSADTTECRPTVYREKQLRKFLDDNGYKGYEVEKVGENSLGTFLYLTIENDSRERLILTVSENQHVQAIPFPAGVYTKVYLNDKQEIAVWSESDEGRLLHFSCGVQMKMDKGERFLVDPSGRYIVFHTSKEGDYIAKVDAPETPLCKLEEGIGKPFVIGDRLYLCNTELELSPKGKGYHKRSGVSCRVFKIESDKLEFLEKRIIPRPGGPRYSSFYVWDMNPDTRELVIVDWRDMPVTFRSRFHIYDWDSGKLSRFKTCHPGKGCHFLKPNLANLGKSK